MKTIKEKAVKAFSAFREVLEENIIELFLLIGMILVSIGFFIWSTVLGFIVTGILFISLALLLLRGGD